MTRESRLEAALRRLLHNVQMESEAKGGTKRQALARLDVAALHARAVLAEPVGPDPAVDVGVRAVAALESLRRRVTGAIAARVGDDGTCWDTMAELQATVTDAGLAVPLVEDAPAPGCESCGGSGRLAVYGRDQDLPCPMCGPTYGGKP